MRRKYLIFLTRVAPGREGEANFACLDALYSQPDRCYHNWRHILACLKELKPLRSRCRSFEALEMAVWYHDAVYDPRRQDNELESARLARRAGDELGLSAALLDEVEALIRLTNHRRVSEGDRPGAEDARLFVDIDLAVLGRGRRAFAAYEAAIRREYGFVGDREYRRRRRALLKEFLERPYVYASPYFRRRCETRARRNLTDALVRLGLPCADGRPPGRGSGG
jgi:predicted metal-dependent HD superfamily phosphohydrolase